MLAFRIDRIGGLHDFPGEVRFHDRVLVDAKAAVCVQSLFETRLAERRAKVGQLVTAHRRGGPACHQRGALGGRAVAVLAANLDRRANLAIELRVAVAVLFEVAVGTMHSAFQMDVHQMYGHVFALLARLPFGIVGRRHGGHELRGGNIGNHVTFVIEHVSRSVLFEHCPEHPAVPVEIGELRVPRQGIQVGDIR